MKTETIKQRGTSYNRLSNQPYLKPKKELPTALQIGKCFTWSAAQAMTAIAYGDCHNVNISMRSLDFKTKCENYQDFAACLKIIEQYNEFESKVILKNAFWGLNLQQFLNTDNCNNGSSLFTFHIAREGSPAFYVSWNEYFDNKIVKDTEEVEATLTEEGRTIIYWEQYTEEDFRTSMAKIAGQIKADEFTIEESNHHGHRYFEARFWFD